MAAILKYQGRSFSDTKQKIQYKQTYIGTESEIDSIMSGLAIGTSVQNKGFLQSYRKQQAEGPFWLLQIIYTSDHSELTFSTIPSSVVGKKSAVLTCRNISLPLQSLDNYLMNWNHFLIQKVGKNQDSTTPQWWEDSGYGDFIPIEDRQTYRWITSLSEVPLEIDSDGKFWIVCENPTKPGIEYYQFAVYQVQQMARFNSAQAAGESLSKNLNHIVAPSNTFGISGGNWKMDQSTVSYAPGSYWLATTTYSHSPDGWDESIYGSASGGGPSSNNNNNNSSNN